MVKVKLYSGETYGITDKMTGKMEGMWSLNTSPSTNPFCQKMQDVSTNICYNCYSQDSETRWKNAKAAWAHNGAVLSSRLLKDPEVLDLSTHKSAPDIFRFQAHGDLINAKHYKNLIKIAEANPKVMFALFTKHLAVVNKVGVYNLRNLIHIYSTPQLNRHKPIKPKGFDKVFSVYTRVYTSVRKIKINCGAKECITCRQCYTKAGPTFINELIKSERS